MFPQQKYWNRNMKPNSASSNPSLNPDRQYFSYLHEDNKITEKFHVIKRWRLKILPCNGPSTTPPNKHLHVNKQEVYHFPYTTFIYVKYTWWVVYLVSIWTIRRRFWWIVTHRSRIEHILFVTQILLTVEWHTSADLFLFKFSLHSLTQWNQNHGTIC